MENEISFNPEQPYEDGDIERLDLIQGSDVLPPGSFHAELSGAQIGSIKRCVDLGLQLQKELPEIAEDYRNGLSLSKIAEKYEIAAAYQVPLRLAETAVYNAIKGYDGHLHMVDSEPYTGLIDDPNELLKIGKEHNVESSRILGEQLKEEGRGIFSLTPEERSTIGKRSGEKQFRESLNIHAHTPEQRREVGRMGARAQGSNPFNDEEINLLMDLAAIPEYQRRSRINAIKIANEINQRLYNGENIRTADQVVKQYSKRHKDAHQV